MGKQVTCTNPKKKNVQSFELYTIILGSNKNGNIFTQHIDKCDARKEMTAQSVFVAI